MTENSFDGGCVLQRCFDAALRAVRPEAVLGANVFVDERGIGFVRGTQRAFVTHPDRARGGRLRLLAFGKAAARFAHAFLAAAPGTVDEGLVVVKEGHAEPVPNCWILEAAHPVPDLRSVAAGEAVLAFAGRSRAVDRHVVLLSGGASSLVVAPIEGCTLADKIALTQAALRSGASIAALNAERKKLSRLKGGKLAALLGDSASLVLAISDVEGDDPGVIASGPMSPSAGVAETVSYALVATPDDALTAFAAQAQREDCRVTSLGRSMYGDLDDCIASFETALSRLPDSSDVPQMLLAAGEPTVRLRGVGRGGRCQEFALRLARTLQGRAGVTVLAAGTDGTDGPTDATGAIVDGTSWPRMVQEGVDPLRRLADNDSHRALAAADALLRTGPTGTNVADLYAALVYRLR